MYTRALNSARASVRVACPRDIESNMELVIPGLYIAGDDSISQPEQQNARARAGKRVRKSDATTYTCVHKEDTQVSSSRVENMAVG